MYSTSWIGISLDEVFVIKVQNMKYHMCKCKICATNNIKVDDYNIKCANNEYKT